jgi:hypothetical protein
MRAPRLLVACATRHTHHVLALCMGSRVWQSGGMGVCPPRSRVFSVSVAVGRKHGWCSPASTPSGSPRSIWAPSRRLSASLFDL